MARQNHSTFGEQQLFRYAQDGKWRKVERIFERERNFPVDILNNKGQTLLYVSCLHHRLKVAAVLLQFGADPNRRSKDGSTPTHAAAYSCSSKLLRCIVEDYGGDMRLHDKQMRTPKDWAIRAGRSVNNKVLQLVAMWQGQVDEKLESTKQDYCRLANMSKSKEILKSKFEIDYCGYGSFLQSSMAKNTRYLGISAVLPLASSTSLESSGNLSLTIKTPPGFIMEEAFWCRHKVMIKRSQGKSFSLTRATEDLLISEAKACRHLRHPNLLLLMSICLTSPEESYTGAPSHWLIYEPIQVGSLYHVLHDLESDVTPADAAKLMIQIGEALSYLHQRGYVHCAVTSHAVYLTGNDIAKLGDLCCVHSDGDTSLSIPISATLIRWVAPEVILKGMLSFATDVYSYCAVVAEALSGSVPWCGCDNASVERHIKNRRNYFLLPDWLPCSLEKIVQNGLKFHSHNRTVTIRDISECLTSLLKSGELKSKQTEEYVHGTYGSQFSNLSGVFPEKLTPSPSKIGMLTNEALELEATGDTYVTAGIDVPDAGPINVTHPKGILTTAVRSNSPAVFLVEGPRNNEKCTGGQEDLGKHFDQMQTKPVEIAKRPHSCSILTRDGMVREVLPSVRRSSFPDVCGTNLLSCEQSLPPSYCDIIQQPKKCSLVETRPQNMANHGLQCTIDMETHLLPFTDNMVAIQHESNMAGSLKVPFNMHSEPVGVLAPLCEGQNMGKPSGVNGPPSKIYAPEPFPAISPPLLLPSTIKKAVSGAAKFKCCDETLSPDLAHSDGLWYNSKKTLDGQHPHTAQAKEDVNDVPDGRARHLIQRTISYPGVQRPVSSKHQHNTMRQASTGALLRRKLRKSVDYADFTCEERYDIENNDLEIIFGSFAERKMCKNTRTPLEMEPPNLSPVDFQETFSNKASQTDSTSEPGGVHPFRPCTDNYDHSTGTENPKEKEFKLLEAPNECNVTNGAYLPSSEVTEVCAFNQHSNDSKVDVLKTSLICESEADNLGSATDEGHAENLCVKSTSSAFVTCLEKNEESNDDVPVPGNMFEAAVLTESSNIEGKTTDKEVQHESQGVESAMAVISSQAQSEDLSQSNGFLSKVEFNRQDQIQEAGENAFEVVIPLSSSQVEPEISQQPSIAEIRGHGIVKPPDKESVFEIAVAADSIIPKLTDSDQEANVMPRSRHAKLKVMEHREKAETPSKWSFQKKLFLFKVVADTGEKGQLGRKAMTQNAYSRVQQAVEKFEGQSPPPSPRLHYPAPVEPSASTQSCARDFIQGDSSGDDSSSTIYTNRLMQEKVGGTFKTSTPLSPPQPTHSHAAVECKHAVTPRSFEEVRAEIEAASTSKSSQFSIDKQSESQINCNLQGSIDAQEYEYAQICKKTDSCAMICPSGNPALCDNTAPTLIHKEAVENSYQDLAIHPSRESETWSLALGIVKGIIETAIAVARQDTQPSHNYTDAKPARSIEEHCCTDDESYCGRTEMSRQHYLTNSFTPGKRTFDVTSSFITSEHPLMRRKLAYSLPVDLDMAGILTNRQGHPCAGRKPRSYPELINAVNSGTDGDGQECSSFLSEDRQSLRCRRSVDTSVWSFLP